MALTAGSRLGPYEIRSVLGAGGMGEVYRARDTSLGRDVAIKILPPAFSADPGRRARFEREARLLATLNHPHIGGIYGMEDCDGAPALVLELVEGDTLAGRLQEGRLPVKEALTIAQQIAAALDAAHEKGITHRDLKPSNIQITPAGIVKVLDFGLAKAAIGDASGRDVAQSPTITIGGTSEGVILGTAAYMSPEQARGQMVDKRTDIWAFGCVVYEMLTGRAVFAGTTVSDTIAAILGREPVWSELPATTPAPIRRLLGRCLEKDATHRLRDIGDARGEIDDVLAGAPDAIGEASLARRVPLWRRVIPPSMAALAGAAAATIMMWTPLRPSGVVKSTISPASSAPLSIGGFDRDVAISPDGTQIVYRGNDQLLVRPIDSFEPTVLVKGGNPQGVFFSPDGQSIGFFDVSSTLKTVGIGGGPTTTLAVTADQFPRGATWGDDDTIVFANPNTGLQRVSSSGGESTVLLSPDRGSGETGYLWPDFLPGSRTLLVTITGSEGPQIAAIDVHSRTRKTLGLRGSGARYVASGHLLYGVGADLLAVPFDLDRLEKTGPAVVVLRDLANTAGGGVNADVSQEGTLAYLPGSGGFAGERSLVWVDRSGMEQPVPGAPPRTYLLARLSPDGLWAAVDIRDQDNDVWVFGFGPQTLRRLTSAPGTDMYAVWSLDSQQVIFSKATDKTGRRDLVRRATDASTPEQRLLEGDQGATYRPFGLAPNGTTLLLGVKGDIFSLDMSAAARQKGVVLKPLIQTPSNEQNAEVSPDGRWVAFQSDESSNPEIYVTSFPDPGGRTQVSLKGGRTLFGRTTDRSSFTAR